MVLVWTPPTWTSLQIEWTSNQDARTGAIRLKRYKHVHRSLFSCSSPSHSRSKDIFEGPPLACSSPPRPYTCIHGYPFVDDRDVAFCIPFYCGGSRFIGLRRRRLPLGGRMRVPRSLPLTPYWYTFEHAVLCNISPTVASSLTDRFRYLILRHCTPVPNETPPICPMPCTGLDLEITHRANHSFFKSQILGSNTSTGASFSSQQPCCSHISALYSSFRPHRMTELFLSSNGHA